MNDGRDARALRREHDAPGAEAEAPDALAGGSGGGPGRRGTGGFGGGPWDDGRDGSGSGDSWDGDESGGEEESGDAPAHEPAPDPESGDLNPDELALSRLLKQAVQDVEPGRGTLDQLRRAVPARRARKRQAAITLAAAAVLLGAATPAVVHLTGSGSSDADRTSVAGHGEQLHGGTAGGKDTDGGRQGVEPSGAGGQDGKGGHQGTGNDSGRHDGGATEGPDPDRSLAASSPACVASALGDAQATLGPADADGRVYGTFKVTNISDGDCTVDGAGTVATVAQGAADPAKINVVDHTEGDPASRLPSPSLAPAQLILQPGMAYEVKFAWVPSGSCQSGGGDGGSSPGPTPSGGTGSGGGADLSSQLAGEDGQPIDGTGSVTVSHTSEPGAPSASATIANACEGTLYRTGLLPGS